MEEAKLPRTPYAPDGLITRPRNFFDIPEEYRDIYIARVYNPLQSIEFWMGNINPKSMKATDLSFLLLKLEKAKESIVSMVDRRSRNHWQLFN